MNLCVIYADIMQPNYSLAYFHLL